MPFMHSCDDGLWLPPTLESECLFLPHSFSVLPFCSSFPFCHNPSEKLLWNIREFSFALYMFQGHFYVNTHCYDLLLSRHEVNLIPLMHLIFACLTWRDYCTMKTFYTFQNSNLPPRLLKPAAKATGSVLPRGMMSHCRMCQRRTASTAMHQCLCLSFPLFPILAPSTGQSGTDLTVRTHWSSYCVDGV